MSPRTVVVVNPQSRSGATGRRWKRVEQRVRAALGSIEVEHTDAPRDAERIAREAVRAGYDRVVVAGGDGTLNEVVSGLLGAGLGGYAAIGLLPMGTGDDFAQGLGIPRGLDAALACLVQGDTRKVDAGRVQFLGDPANTAPFHFANVASFGLSGLVVELVNASSKALGGRIAFLLGTLRALARHRGRPVTLRVDGELVFDGRLTFTAAANGRYFGGGIHIAPRARLDDGLLDVVIVPDLSRTGLLARLPSIYFGTHLEGDAARFHRGRMLEADAAPGSVSLEMDGELLGNLPARVDVLPGALTFLAPGE